MSETQRDIPTFNSVAAEVGELVTTKNAAYGDSFAKCGEFLRLLYPDGLEPAKYGDALSMVRIFDKQMRIATRKDAFGESPYKDIAGYAILGATADAKLAQFHTPLSPSEVKEIAESVAPPVLCDTCVRDKCPPEQRGGIATECAGYLDPVAPAEEKAPAPFSLPSAKFSYNFPAAEKFMGMLKSDYVVKLRSEVSEVSDAIGPRDAAIELMDVTHVAETALRTLAKDYGLDLDDLADHVVAKNRQRGYYTQQFPLAGKGENVGREFPYKNT